MTGSQEARGWRMVQAGEMPVPFPGSWCRLTGKGSLRQGRPLGSPQPACVSFFLRVDSSNIHCSRARRIGTYHPGGEAGRRDPGRARRLPRRLLRILELRAGGSTLSPSSRPPFPRTLTPGTGRARCRAAQVDGSAQAGGAGDSVTLWPADAARL